MRFPRPRSGEREIKRERARERVGERRNRHRAARDGEEAACKGVDRREMKPHATEKNARARHDAHLYSDLVTHSRGPSEEDVATPAIFC